MKVLLTGFDPFGGETVNPALEAVMKLSAPEGMELIRLEVPTVFGKSINILTEAALREKPDAIVCVGQAGGRRAITPERVAVNIMDASSADNEGNCPVDVPIVPGGENALFSTLPVKKMVSKIKEAGIPAALSNTAGTFVCNQLMYAALNLCKTRLPNTAAGFIHVPFLPRQVDDKPGLPSLSEDDIIRGLEAALSALI